VFYIRGKLNGYKDSEECNVLLLKLKNIHLISHRYDYLVV